MRGTPRNNKSTRPAASCFHPFFGRFGTPDETLALVFIYFFKRMAQRTFSFPALCFASDDPRTSCLFTNTAHVIRYVLTCQHTLLYKDLFSLITHLKPVGGGGGGGYSWEFVVGLCRTVVQILILFHQTKKSHFPHPSSDLPEAEIMLSLLRLER